jgi:FkbM family methyltransferase
MIINLKDMIAKHQMKINGVVHIGAHFGQECEEYASCGVDTMLLYEAHPNTFSVLSQNITQFPKAIAINKGLGATAGVLSLKCSKNNQGMSNSFLLPKDHKEIYPYIVFDHEISVPITTLDSEMRSLSPEVSEKINFISMDVQGFELQVLLGAKNVLPQIDYIMTEINTRQMYENCVLVEELDAFLMHYGFTRSETSNTDAGWGDALYIKNGESNGA